ncbi:MAG: hypothetical protein HZB61_11610 [Nitrospirae bacterium]|nr:hypothetical protein [Nitrospirota bacterium]
MKDSFVRFQILKLEWESETAHLSSITEISMHPAYQQIIGMGQVAVPFILSTGVLMEEVLLRREM